MPLEIRELVVKVTVEENDHRNVTDTKAIRDIEQRIKVIDKLVEKIIERIDYIYER